MSDVSIVDYGIGNVLSVQRAFEYVGASVDFVGTSDSILKANRIVLPGVGAFHKGIKELQNRNLLESLCEYCQQDRPFLGICLGMQLMFDSSEEFGKHKGLGVIGGIVKQIENTSLDGEYQKVPHVGWNKLQFESDDKILNGIPLEPSVYFVHSYAAYLNNPSQLLATTNYGGRNVSALVKVGNNVYGAQFHPEKSGKIGLTMIRNFSKL